MTRSSDQMLSRIRELAPSIAGRAREIEAARTVPPDIIAELREIGVFRMLTPKSHGGLEMSLPEFVQVLAAIAAADGSTGWAAMIGSGTGLLFSRLPRATFEAIYAAGPDVIQAGTIMAAGTAETVEGGYRVSGRWPFGSGSPHAGWIFGGCKIMKDGAPVAGPTGQPMEKLLVLPAKEWTIEDTWHAGGLKGSGSHHVSLESAFVPDANAFALDGPSCLPGPLYAAVGAYIPFFHAAFAVGLAQGVFDDLLAMAGTGRQQYRSKSSMRETPIFQYELGRAQADLRAAQAYLKTQAESQWQLALTDAFGAPTTFFDGLQMNVWVTEACTRVIDRCYTLGGGGALYESSPLQRRLRDMHAATQHVATAQRHYMSFGALSVGLPPTTF